MRRIAAAAALAAAALLAPARPADACGAFIARTEGLRLNDALEMVVVREGTRTSMSVRNRYRGPVEEFALLVPVPQVLQPGDVVTLDDSVFDALIAATSPQLHHLREDDPCRPPSKGEGAAGAGAPRGDLGVTVESQFQVGEYDVAVLSATDAAGLDAWLAAHDYRIGDDLAPLLRPYVDAGTKFFVAKVDPARVTFVDGVATLSPLRFAFDVDEVSLPLRLSTANSPGTQDVIVHAIARARLDARNRPHLTIPTGVEMTYGAPGGFRAFYEALFARTIAQAPTAVVTEFARHGGYDLRDVLPALGASGEPDTWVVTRLHLRIAKDAMHDDLVLGEVGAIRGGLYEGTQDAIPADRNDFRAEYEVKQPWDGEVRCAEPRWGVWKPDGDGLTGALGVGITAVDAPLEALVATDVPRLAVKATHPRPTHDEPARPRRARRGGGDGGCGCAAGGDHGGTFALVLVVMVALGSRRARPRARDARARRV